MSHFHSHWSSHPRFAAFTAPRRPRHPLLRLALGVVGLALLIGLLFLSVFVGLAMLAGGLVWRLWKQRGKPHRIVDADGISLAIAEPALQRPWPTGKVHADISITLPCLRLFPLRLGSTDRVVR